MHKLFHFTGFQMLPKKVYNACSGCLPSGKSCHGNKGQCYKFAKSQVAHYRVPLPYLELCDSYLLVKIIHHCIQLLAPLRFINLIKCWLDSPVRMAYAKTPYSLKIYIANRLTKYNIWYFQSNGFVFLPVKMMFLVADKYSRQFLMALCDLRNVCGYFFLTISDQNRLSQRQTWFKKFNFKTLQSFVW